MTKRDDQAFPGLSEVLKIPFLGLTKREYFAAMLGKGMTAAAANEREKYENHNLDRIFLTPSRVASMACEYADALIAALNEEKP